MILCVFPIFIILSCTPIYRGYNVTECKSLKSSPLEGVGLSMSVHDTIMLVATVVQTVVALIVLGREVWRDLHGTQRNNDHKEKTNR